MATATATAVPPPSPPSFPFPLPFPLPSLEMGERRPSEHHRRRWRPGDQEMGLNDEPFKSRDEDGRRLRSEGRWIRRTGNDPLSELTHLATPGPAAAPPGAELNTKVEGALRWLLFGQERLSFTGTIFDLASDTDRIPMAAMGAAMGGAGPGCMGRSGLRSDLLVIRRLGAERISDSVRTRCASGRRLWPRDARVSFSNSRVAGPSHDGRS